MAVVNSGALKNTLCEHTRATFQKANAKVGIVGVSGGVNSALALGVLVDALGPQNVCAIYLGAYSNPKSYQSAKTVAKSQGVKLRMLDLTSDVYSLWHQLIMEEDTKPYDALNDPKEQRTQEKITAAQFQAALVARGSIRSCIRATMLDAAGKAFAFSRAMEHGDDNYNVLIMGTGDEGEDRFFRFFNKRGDGAVDISLLSSLSKNEHRQAAVLCYNVPREIAYQVSGPDLQYDALLPGQAAHIAEEEMSRQFGAILTYGSIDPKTDKYATYGTLEWVAREDDASGAVANTWTPINYSDTRLSDVVRSARKYELATRHKRAEQTTIPRQVFLEAGAVINGPDSDLPISFEIK